MRDAERFKLRYGPYRTPRFRYGSIKQCALQGDVRIIGMSDGRIPWPIAIKLGSRGAGRGFVLYADLAKAVKREAGIAVAYWWGVRRDTVSRWRKALGVGRSNDSLGAADDPQRQRLGDVAEQVSPFRASAPGRVEKPSPAQRRSLGRRRAASASANQRPPPAGQSPWQSAGKSPRRPSAAPAESGTRATSRSPRLCR